MPPNLNIFEDVSQNLLQTISELAGKLFNETAVEFVHDMASWTAERWAKQAQAENPGWGSIYASAIKTDLGKDFARIYVDMDQKYSDKAKAGLFVSMMEEGVDPWSIKDALLASDRARLTNDGMKYIVVPFRWRTPTTKKFSSSFQGVIPGDIYQAIKGGGTLKGDFGHMTGLTKVNTKPHSAYFTFRMVTENSKGWQHPGKAATPVYPIVLDKVQKAIGGAIKGMVKDFEKKLRKST